MRKFDSGRGDLCGDSGGETSNPVIVQRVKSGSGAWTRTKILGSKGPCATNCTTPEWQVGSAADQPTLTAANWKVSLNSSHWNPKIARLPSTLRYLNQATSRYIFRRSGEFGRLRP